MYFLNWRHDDKMRDRISGNSVITANEPFEYDIRDFNVELNR